LLSGGLPGVGLASRHDFALTLLLAVRQSSCVDQYYRKVSAWCALQLEACVLTKVETEGVCVHACHESTILMLFRKSHECFLQSDDENSASRGKGWIRVSEVFIPGRWSSLGTPTPVKIPRLFQEFFEEVQLISSIRVLASIPWGRPGRHLPANPRSAERHCHGAEIPGRMSLVYCSR
jgi:hypothetical protein